MRILKWGNLNPTLRHVLHPDSDKWTLKAALRLVLFFVFLPLWVIGTIWAIAADTDWQQVGAALDKLLWLLIGVLGWGFQKIRSLSGTDILLICILLMLLRIAGQILALQETVDECLEEWRSQHDDGGDYPE